MDPAKWTKTLESATAVYKNDPQIQTLTASMNFTVISQYFVNTEGTVTRNGSAHYQIVFECLRAGARRDEIGPLAAIQASHMEELPTPDEFQKDALNLVADA